MGSLRGGEGSKQGLVDTSQGLQRALERSRKECQAAVSSAKYMQVTAHCLPLAYPLPAMYTHESLQLLKSSLEV